MEFRKLRANEIDVRVGTVPKSGTGLSLLLYKDARVDMNILDETFGIFGWQRHHELIDGQLFCIVSIYDENKKTWVNKQDVGIESNTEEVKGRASDSFKRACTNWGIGRELYTAPFIWISNKQGKVDDLKRLDYRVSDISYDVDGNINNLSIDMKGRLTSYEWQQIWTNQGYVESRPKQEPEVEKKIDIKSSISPKLQEIFDLIREHDIPMEKVMVYMKTALKKEKSTDLNEREIDELHGFVHDLVKAKK